MSREAEFHAVAFWRQIRSEPTESCRETALLEFTLQRAAGNTLKRELQQSPPERHGGVPYSATQ